MICRYHGKYLDFEHIKQVMGTNRNGVSVQDIISVAEGLSLRSNAYRLTFKDLRTLMPLPCIVHWGGDHFVVVYKITKSRVYVADPGKGRITYSIEEFISNWKESDDDETGICIGCEPTAEFNSIISETKPNNSLEAWFFLKSYVKPYRKQVVQIVFLLGIITLLTSLIPIITQSIMDSGIPRRDNQYITILLVGSIALGVGLALGKWLQQSIGLYFAVRVKMFMMADYISRMFKMPLQFFESRTIGSILQRNYDFDRIESFLLSSLFGFILSVFSLITFGLLLFVYDSTLFWIFFVCAILYVSWILTFWSIRKNIDIKYYTFLAQNESRWIEFINNILDIKSYAYGYEERKKWEKTQVGLFKTRVKLLNINQLQGVGTNLISSIRDAILVFVAAKAVIAGEISIGTLGAVLFIVGQLKAPLDSVVSFIISWQFFQISFGRVSDVYKTKAEDESNGTNDSMASYQQPIVLKSVSFRYSPSSPYVLNRVNYAFPQGKITAVVGASGSGKSTLIKLLVRLYEPTYGTICLNDTHLNNISTQLWRSHIGVLTQDSYLVSDTISNNISYGRPFDAEKMAKAVNIANIQHEIESMPLGFETVIGEKGKGVSEGQKQRILLARALYDDPEYILLDEITSTLDSRNEFMIMSSIKKNLVGKTVIITAHRLSTVMVADEICVMKNGFIVEHGTHEQLVENRKDYFDLFRPQLVRYENKTE